jgi:hypothetical protein
MQSRELKCTRHSVTNSRVAVSNGNCIVASHYVTDMKSGANWEHKRAEVKGK